MEQKNNLYWKRFLEIIWSNLQVSLEQVDQEFIQLSSEQGQRPHSLTRQPVSTLGNPHRKKYFLILHQNFLYFNLNPSPFILLLHNSRNSLSLFSLHPPGGINSSEISHQPFLLQLKTWFSQSLLAHQMTQSSNQLSGPQVNSLR